MTNLVVEKSDLQLLDKFSELIKKGGFKAAIFTHPHPDPDALGSMMGLKWLFGKYNISADLFYTGAISHPQNRSLDKLLDTEVLSLEN